MSVNIRSSDFVLPIAVIAIAWGTSSCYEAEQKYKIEKLKIEQKAIVHGESDTEVREKK